MNPPPREVTVIINNRDLLAWPRAMLERIRRFQGLKEVIFVDNGSTNRELLAWYKSIPEQVLFLDNLGHTAPWQAGLPARISTDLYVVTDPDLDLDGLPDDCLLQLAAALERHPEAGKIGLSLRTEGVPARSPYAAHVAATAARLAQAPRTGDGLIGFPVDTTFAIHDRRQLSDYRICGLRMPEPYAVRHIPWHVVEPEGEFLAYLDKVQGGSSSYASFTGHQRSDSVRALYRRHHGKVSSKWDSYLDVYEENFRPFKDQPIDMLEIGVQNGGSLDIWSRYFGKARSLTGCDINPACGQLRYDDPRVQVIVGNANDPATYGRILQRCPQFDIVIDDGSHRAHDVLTSFLSYFPRVKPGGLYIMEDMHCAYWEAYGGGLFNERSPAAFIKRLIDSLNRDHFQDGATAGRLFQGFLPSATAEQFIAEHGIVSITSYDSVFLIRKASAARPRGLGECVVVGEVAAVDIRALPADRRAAA